MIFSLHHTPGLIRSATASAHRRRCFFRPLSPHSGFIPRFFIPECFRNAFFPCAAWLFAPCIPKFRIPEKIIHTAGPSFPHKGISKKFFGVYIFFWNFGMFGMEYLKTLDFPMFLPFRFIPVFIPVLPILYSFQLFTFQFFTHFREQILNFC